MFTYLVKLVTTRREIGISERQEYRNARQLALAEVQNRRERFRTGFSILGSAATVVAIVAVFVSVHSLNQQTRQAVEQQQLARYQSVSQRGLDLDRIFIDHPNLRKYFVDSAAVLPDDREAASAVASTVIDYFQYAYNQMSSQGIVPSSGDFITDPNTSNQAWLSWSTYIADQFGHSPIMCSVLADTKAEYVGEFVGAVRNLKICAGL